MVGTNVGNTHRERQGTGLATVVDISEGVAAQKEARLADAAKAKADAAEKKALAASFKKMTDFQPDYFMKHDQEMQNRLRGWMEKGAEYIRDNGSDPWSSTDDSALEWQKEKGRIEQLARNSEQVKELWLKDYSPVFKDPKKLAKLKNKDEIAKYFDNPSIISMSGSLPPRLEWETPEIDTYKTVNGFLSEWDKNHESKVMGTKDSYEAAIAMIGNPIYSEGPGSGFMGLQEQRYGSLPDEMKEAFEAEAERTGMPNGMVPFLATQLKSHRGGVTENLTDLFTGIAQGKKLSDFGSDDGTNTVKGKYFKGGDKAARKEIRAHLGVHTGQVERDVEQGVYGSPNKTMASNMKSAEDYYLKVFNDALATGSVKGKKNDKRSDEEIAAEDEKWLADIRGDDLLAKEEALGYMRGGEKEDGTKVVSSSKIGIQGPFLNEKDRPEAGIEIKSVKGYKGEDDEGNAIVDKAKSTEFLDIKNMSDEELLKFKRAADEKKSKYKGVRDGSISNLYGTKKAPTDDLY